MALLRAWRIPLVVVGAATGMNGDEGFLHQVAGLRGIAGEPAAKKRRQLALKTFEQGAVRSSIAGETRQHQRFHICVWRSHPASITFA